MMHINGHGPGVYTYIPPLLLKAPTPTPIIRMAACGGSWWKMCRLELYDSWSQHVMSVREGVQL